jgi:hypothetical protein
MKSTILIPTLLAAGLCQAQTLIDFTMEEHTEATNLEFDTNGTPQNTLSATSTLATGISNPNAYGLGTFGTGGGGTQDGELNWSHWAKNAEFLVVEFTVDAGSIVTLSDLTMDVSRNGAGAPANWYAVVLPGTGLTAAELAAGTHLDEHTPVTSGNAGGSVGKTDTWDLSSTGNLYAGSYTIGWGTSSSAVGNMRVSDIVINGVVPEPSVALLGGLGLFGLLLRRRR